MNMLSFAFDENEIPWVQNQMLPIIEERSNLKCCVHKRDFVPGNAIVDNICVNMHKSRKVILVMSEAFLRSKWCQFEFKMAHSLSVERGTHMLIFVLLKKITKFRLTEEMRLLLETYSYIEWPTSRHCTPAFWQKVREA